jgi:hypothetical protein
MIWHPRNLRWLPSRLRSPQCFFSRTRAVSFAPTFEVRSRLVAVPTRVDPGSFRLRSWQVSTRFNGGAACGAMRSAIVAGVNRAVVSVSVGLLRDFRSGFCPKVRIRFAGGLHRSQTSRRSSHKTPFRFFPRRAASVVGPAGVRLVQKQPQGLQRRGHSGASVVEPGGCT